MTYPIRHKFENELGNPIMLQIRNVMGTDEVLDHCVEIDIEGPNSSDEWTITPMEAFILMELLCEHHGYDLVRIKKDI